MGIIPNRKRFKSWSMPTKILVIFGLLSLIIPFLIFFLELIFQKTPNEIIDNPIIHNEEHSQVTNTYIKKDPKKYLTYNLTGIKNFTLKRLIMDSLQISLDKDSKNTIEISQTGEVQLLSEGIDSYIYTGGFIKIIIDGNNCYEFQDFSIPSMRPNSKYILMNELDKVINVYVDENLDKFLKKINQCIKR